MGETKELSVSSNELVSKEFELADYCSVFGIQSGI